MNPLPGTKADFGQRIRSNEQKLNKDLLVKNAFQTKLKVLIFRILDFLKIGHFRQNLNIKVADLKKELESDKFKLNVENFNSISDTTTIPEEWGGYLKEWKGAMCSQRTLLEDCILKENRIQQKIDFKDYDYISALVKQVKSCVNVQKNELSSQNQMARSFLNFVGEKIKGEAQEALAGINSMQTQALEDDGGMSKDQINRIHHGFYQDKTRKLNAVIKSVEPKKSGDLVEQFKSLRINEGILKASCEWLLIGDIEFMILMNNSKLKATYENKFSKIKELLEKETDVDTDVDLDKLDKEVKDQLKKCVEIGKYISECPGIVNDALSVEKNTPDTNKTQLKKLVNEQFLPPKQAEFNDIQDKFQILSASIDSRKVEIEKAKTRVPDPAWLEKIGKEYGLQHVTVPGDGDCLFKSCLEGIKNNPKVSDEIKKFDVQRFREGVVDYMRQHLTEFKEQILLELTQMPSADLALLPQALRDASNELASLEVRESAYEKLVSDIKAPPEAEFDKFIKGLEKEMTESYQKVGVDTMLLKEFTALKSKLAAEEQMKLEGFLNDVKNDSLDQLNTVIESLSDKALDTKGKEIVGKYWQEKQDLKQIETLWKDESIKTEDQLAAQLTQIQSSLSDNFKKAWVAKQKVSLVNSIWKDNSIQDEVKAKEQLPKDLKEPFGKLWVARQDARELNMAWNTITDEASVNCVIEPLSAENKTKFMNAWKAKKRAVELKQQLPELYLNEIAKKGVFGGANEILAIRKWLNIPVRLFNTPKSNKPYIHFSDNNDEALPENRSEALFLIRPPTYPHFDYMIPIAESKK